MSISRGRAALPLLLLLAGCGGGISGRADLGTTLPDTPEVVACREEARGTGEARDLWREMNLADRTQMSQVRQRQAEAEQRAFNECLRRRGLVRGGGVEAVRPPGLR